MQPQADHGHSAKRYERMMKANGIHQSQSGGTTVSDTPVSSRGKTSPSAGPSNKKRKLDKYAETTSNLNTDDDEGLGDVKGESSSTVKAEPTIKAESIKAELVKEEPNGQEDSAASTSAFQYPSSGTMGFDGANDSSLFDDFLAFGGSIKPDHEIQAALNGGFSDEGVAPMSMTPSTGDVDPQALQESILIVD